MNQNLTTIQAQPWMQKSYKPLVLSDFATKAECRNMLQTVDLLQSRLCSREFAAKALLLIMELYQDKGKNPETYGAFVVNALRTFPEVIVEKMLSPRFGIVAECKFPPTVAEIVRWCEKQVEECNLARVKAEKRLLEIERRKQVSVSSPEFKSTSTADERAAIVKRVLGSWYDKWGQPNEQSQAQGPHAATWDARAEWTIAAPGSIQPGNLLAAGTPGTAHA